MDTHARGGGGCTAAPRINCDMNGIVRWRVDLFSAWVVFCALISATVMLYCTRNGPGITIDSTRYVAAAKHPAALLGIPGASAVRDVRYPPMLPAALAVSRFWNGTIDNWARALDAMLLIVNVLLLGAILIDAGRSRGWIAFWCVAIFALASDMLMLHSFIWSEPLYLTFMLAMIFCMRRYCAGGAEWRWLLLAAGATSLGMLTRYAGASLVLGGAVVVLMAGPAAFKRRCGHLLVFAAVSGALPLLWVASNIAISGSATGRQISMMSPASELARLVNTLLNWWAPSYLPRLARIGIVLLIGIFGLITLVSLGRLWLKAPRFAIRPPLPVILLILSITYVLFLFVSRTWFDHRTPFDWRILSPLFATGLLLNTIILQELWNAPQRKLPIRWALAPLCIVVLLGHVVNTGMVAGAVSRDGLGWNRVRFQDPVLIEAIQNVPQNAKLYSNDAAALEASMDREVLPVPVVSRGGTREQVRLRTFVRNAGSGTAWVLYFPKKGVTADGSLKGIGGTAELRPMVRGSKWTLYYLAPTVTARAASSQRTNLAKRPPRPKRKAAA